MFPQPGRQPLDGQFFTGPNRRGRVEIGDHRSIPIVAQRSTLFQDCRAGRGQTARAFQWLDTRVLYQRYDHKAGSRWGTALKESGVKRFRVNTNSVSDALRSRQANSRADRSGAASAKRQAFPMNPPEVNMATRRPGPQASTISWTARSTRWRNSCQPSNRASPDGRSCQYSSSDSNIR